MKNVIEIILYDKCILSNINKYYENLKPSRKNLVWECTFNLGNFGWHGTLNANRTDTWLTN